MFSWFLKILGIEDDKPVTTNNSYLNTNKTNNQPKAESPAQKTKANDSNEAAKVVEEPSAKKESSIRPLRALSSHSLRPDRTTAMRRGCVKTPPIA